MFNPPKNTLALLEEQYTASRVIRKSKKAMPLLRGASPFVCQYGGLRDRGCELNPTLEFGEH
jgi:hypothetical protein